MWFNIGKHANHKIMEFFFTFVLVYNDEISNQLVLALQILTKINR